MAAIILAHTLLGRMVFYLILNLPGVSRFLLRIEKNASGNQVHRSLNILNMPMRTKFYVQGYLDCFVLAVWYSMNAQPKNIFANLGTNETIRSQQSPFF